MAVRHRDPADYDGVASPRTRRRTTSVQDYSLTAMSKDLQKAADYTVNEAFTVDTRDHEDHTFSGVMFTVRAQTVLPVQFVELQSLWVRGGLGKMTVWSTPNDYEGKAENPAVWAQRHCSEQRPSPERLVELPLRPPLLLRPGESAGLYVHSGTDGDRGLVYDDVRQEYTYEDRFLQVFPGQAHLCSKPFGKTNPWGWGGAWRQGREFVGRVTYGARYVLWTPLVHQQFPPGFRRTARALLYCRHYYAMQCEEDEETIPQEWLFLVLNFCRWDWGGDGAVPFRVTRTAAGVRMLLPPALPAGRNRMAEPAEPHLRVAMMCDEIGARDSLTEVTEEPGEGVTVAFFAQASVAKQFSLAYRNLSTQYRRLPEGAASGGAAAAAGAEEWPEDEEMSESESDSEDTIRVGALVVSSRKPQYHQILQLLPRGVIGRVTGLDSDLDPIVRAPHTGRRAAVSRPMVRRLK
eukprot:TRINITY_DN9607_c0_g1_i1.p1 TRINITY_DN9607_c0_g1~~TRINITY_DN9607_c0_g1_i1.p1  ORF type:complete len:463 (+),score=115.60 TRINITY_DN9607_c0_g1_i1:100-1488(+)